MSPGSSRRLIRNHWSWHTLPANVIYLDAPAFVGFSYSNSSSEIKAVPSLLVSASGATTHLLVHLLCAGPST